MNADSKIFVAGHQGMVGSSIVRELERQGYKNILVRGSKELDLRNAVAVEKFFSTEKPEFVFLAAAKVGGIQANNIYRGEFIYDNLMIQTNVIHSAHVNAVKKLLFLGSSCIYPKMATQPIKEEYFLTGPLEPTNEAYAIAKIAGIGMCQAYHQQYGCNFISAMPTNLYGINDKYDLEKSHVLPALIRKFHEAKQSGSPTVNIWGSGKPLREFMFADDLGKACVLLMLQYNDPTIINIGTMEEVSIKDLALLIQEVVGYKGDLIFDATKPDGTPRKLMDSSRLHQLGFKPKTTLREGIPVAYHDFLKKQNS